MSSLDGMGARVAELIRVTGLSQQEFAERLASSPGFISDIVRGLKRPGAEVLHRIREVFGVSVDWLLDGSGAMYGGRPIEMDSFKLISAQVELVRRARIEGDPKAEVVLSQLLGADTAKPLSPERMVELLKPYVKLAEEFLLPAVIYNSHLWTTNAEERVRGGLSSVVAYFESKRPLDVLKALIGDSGGRPGSEDEADGRKRQLNIGRSVRAAGGDYYERGGGKKKD